MPCLRVLRPFFFLPFLKVFFEPPLLYQDFPEPLEPLRGERGDLEPDRELLRPEPLDEFRELSRDPCLKRQLLPLVQWPSLKKLHTARLVPRGVKTFLFPPGAGAASLPLPFPFPLGDLPPLPSAEWLNLQESPRVHLPAAKS